jgi:hypothetical protein
MGEAASQASAYLGPFSYSVLIAGESLKALSTVMKAIDQSAQHYGQYSPEIAQAQAVAEIRQTMGDFKRAQVVGSEMAKYVIAQSDLQQKVEDVKVKILTKLLPLVTRAVEIIEVIVDTGNNSIKVFETISAPLLVLANAATAGLSMLGKKIDEENLPDDPTKQLFDDKFFDTPAKGGWAPRG